MNQTTRRELNRVKREFPFQIDDKQAKAILEERISLDIEKEQILEECDVIGITPTPETFYGPGPIKKDFYKLPAKIWENTTTTSPISEKYNLGNW